MRNLQKEASKKKKYQIEETNSGLNMKTIQGPSSRFVKVRCQKCKNEQIIFGKAATIVECLVCKEILAKPKGGKAEITGRVVEVLN